MHKDQPILTGLVKIVSPILILLIGIGGFWKYGVKPEVPKREESLDPAIAVQTSMVKLFDESFNIEVEGAAVPYRTLTVSSEVAGRVKHKAKTSRAGSYLFKDDLLFEIDPTDYKLEIERFQSQLNQANAEITSVEVNIKNTEALAELAREELTIQKKDLVRLEGLAKQNAISDREVDEVQRAELVARNSLQTLLNKIATHAQQIKTLEAARNLVASQLKRAEVDLSRTKITSPTVGSIIMGHVEENDYVKKGDPLITLNDSSRAEIKCNLRVEELYWLWLQSGIFRPDADISLKTRLQVPQTPVEVVFEFKGTEYVWKGVLSRYEGTGLDVSTRLVPCRVLVENPTKLISKSTSAAHSQFSIPTLFSGLYVTVRIPVKPTVPLLEIPDIALRPGSIIWVMRDSKLAVIPVKVVHSRNDTELIQPEPGYGLEPGEKVVVSPLANGVDGLLLKELVEKPVAEDTASTEILESEKQMDASEESVDPPEAELTTSESSVKVSTTKRAAQ